MHYYPICKFKISLLRFICIALAIVIIPSCGHSNPSLRGKNLIAVPGIDLKSVYRRLENAGFDPGPYRKDDLAQLSESVRRFQKVAKLKADGILDEKTWAKLRKLYDPSASEATSADRRDPQYSEDAQNAPSAQKPSSVARWPASVVKIIQKMLTNQGYNTGMLNGITDTQTQKAIRQFQKNNGLKINGKLNQETLLFILEKNCENGCKFRILLTASDIMLLSALPGFDVRSISGTFLEVILIQGIQIFLNRLGYDAGNPSGVISADTRQAIRQFQRKHNIPDNGELDNETILSVFSSACNDGCEFFISREVRKSEPEKTTDSKKLRPIKSSQINLHEYPVYINDRAFAVEKFECSDISGDWIIFYEGTVTDKKDDTISLRLEKRFGYRYHPDKEGIDNTDWWCIPKKRHCYSPVKFSDWQGKYSENQVVTFPKSQVYNARITIINGISIFLQQNCNRD